MRAREIPNNKQRIHVSKQQLKKPTGDSRKASPFSSVEAPKPSIHEPNRVLLSTLASDYLAQMPPTYIQKPISDQKPILSLVSDIPPTYMSVPRSSEETPRVTKEKHGNQLGGNLHSVATPVSNGFMSAEDKAKLDRLSPAGDLSTYTAISSQQSNVRSTSDIPMAGIALKPSAGTYLALFDGIFSVSGNLDTVTISFYVDGQQISHSIRPVTLTSGTSACIHTQAYVSFNGDQIIEIRWNCANGLVSQRSLLLWKL